MLDLDKIKSYEPKITSSGFMGDMSEAISHIKIRYVTYDNLSGSFVKATDFKKVMEELIELRKINAKRSEGNKK